jgi:hypothetical protein
VAALANAGTGYLVYGVRTESHVNESVEAATDIVPFPKDAVEVDAFDR